MKKIPLVFLLPGSGERYISYTLPKGCKIPNKIIYGPPIDIKSPIERLSENTTKRI